MQTSDQILRPYSDMLETAIRTGQAVDGDRILADYQRDLARDRAERVFFEAWVDPVSTPAKAQAATTAALWVLTTSMGETCREYAMSDREITRHVARIASAFNERLGELCASAHVTDVRQ